MSDEAKKGFIMFMVLMILTLFISTAVKAEEACEPGSGKGTWTLLIKDLRISLIGSICTVPGSKETPERNLSGKRIGW